MTAPGEPYWECVHYKDGSKALFVVEGEKFSTLTHTLVDRKLRKIGEPLDWEAFEKVADGYDRVDAAFDVPMAMAHAGYLRPCPQCVADPDLHTLAVRDIDNDCLACCPQCGLEVRGWGEFRTALWWNCMVAKARELDYAKPGYEEEEVEE